MLAAIMWIYSYSSVILGAASTNIEVLINELSIPKQTQKLLWLAFFAFCCKNANVASAYLASRCPR